MPTWLDEWCRGMHLRRIEQLAAFGRPRDDFCRSDGLAAREAAFDALAARLSFQERHEDIPMPIAFMSMLAPFFAPPQEPAVVRAFQMTDEGADLLEDLELAPESVAHTREMIGPDWATYIDVPSGVIKLSNEAELRAIFVQPTTMEVQIPAEGAQLPKEVLTYCAIVTPSGRYGWRYALWTDDRSQFIADNTRRERGSHDEVNMPTFDEFLVQAGWSIERLQDEVERITYLVLEHARDLNLARTEDVPHLRADHERRIPGRGDDVARRFSLFRIKRVRPRRRPHVNPQQQGGRPPWRLERRITVMAHRRSVRVPGTNEWRWISVREHQKGPADGLPLIRCRKSDQNSGNPKTLSF
jgi:hypothetical protein